MWPREGDIQCESWLPTVRHAGGTKGLARLVADDLRDEGVTVDLLRKAR